MKNILDDDSLPPLEEEEVNQEFGQFAFRYVTPDGAVVTEHGTLMLTPDGTKYVLKLEGNVTYTVEDGSVITAKFTADEDGYKTQ